MGFFGSEPINPAKTTVTYLWTGLRTPGIFIVEVQGDAPNYSYGFTLVRDPNFVGGLKINSMGWTGPLGQGTTPYTVKGSFPGQFQEQIVVSGSNGDFLIKVQEVPHDQVDNFIKSQVENGVPA
ncbi:hypothetical protein [Taibaiella chishuiensis]|uniref:Uncharacterized protein n=1 Tax=Taibaiella chishuiensis TaxID=1434707 RepID=A0A2P8CSM1_9BACT|nr:hypothetical protein [Taibaiella chishuiensis]PSK87973.1 hypothetical protein B0I18_1163 [Taibaiella chishuiensis]